MTLLPLLAAAQNQPAGNAPAKPPWEQILTWLPEDTETVIVSQHPNEIRKWVSKKDIDPLTERFRFAETVHELPKGPLLSLKDGLLHKELQGLKVRCAVEGSRRFTSPNGLGMMPYQGCHVLQFDPAADGTLKKAFALCLEKADKKITIGDETVAVISEKSENDVWTYFVCRPQPGVLLCAIAQAYLEETLKRMSSPPAKRALPADLPEWKQVDTKAVAWAVRHYRKDTAASDPSSPLRGKAAANESDPNAVGFVFWYDAKADTAQARYLSTSKNAVAIVAKGWRHPGEKLDPTIKRGAEGVVQISSPVGEDRTGSMFLFVLIAYLGHAVYL